MEERSILIVRTVDAQGMRADVLVSVDGSAGHLRSVLLFANTFEVPVGRSSFFFLNRDAYIIPGCFHQWFPIVSKPRTASRSEALSGPDLRHVMHPRFSARCTCMMAILPSSSFQATL